MIRDEGGEREILVLRAALRAPLTDERGSFDDKILCCEEGNMTGIGVEQIGGTSEGNRYGYRAIRSGLRGMSISNKTGQGFLHGMRCDEIAMSDSGGIICEIL